MLNISSKMQEYINAVKETEFYKKYIAKLYICNETPDILWASFKAPYTKMDEVAFWQETEPYDFVLSDADYAFYETDGGSHAYELKEVNNRI